MDKHGLVTWGNTSEEFYRNSVRIINEAENYIHTKSKGIEPFGGIKYEAVPAADRRTIMAEVMPILRGAVGGTTKMIVCFDDSKEVLQFVKSRDAHQLSQ